jgi:hypothetical protein
MKLRWVAVIAVSALAASASCHPKPASGTGGSPGQCLLDGDACVQDDDCCGFVCTNGTCGCGPCGCYEHLCSEDGESCMLDCECCGNACVANACSSCLGPRGTCAQDSDCCSQHCTMNACQ